MFRQALPGTSNHPPEIPGYTLCMSIGSKIELLRKEKSWSQTETAKKLNVSLSAFGRWERDENLPDAEDLKKMADLFEVTSDFLLSDSAPRDGRIDITDVHLLKQFEKADQLEESHRTILKQLIDAFILKSKIEKDVEEMKGST